MQIQFNFANIPSSDALQAHVRHEIDATIGHLKERITRIEVHLADTNGHHKHGPNDKRCMLEARPVGMDPIAVESQAPDYHGAVSDAAGKLKRALTTRLERATAR